jgi:hypothetical protein
VMLVLLCGQSPQLQLQTPLERPDAVPAAVVVVPDEGPKLVDRYGLFHEVAEPLPAAADPAPRVVMQPIDSDNSSVGRASVVPPCCRVIDMLECR